MNDGHHDNHAVKVIATVKSSGHVQICLIALCPKSSRRDQRKYGNPFVDHAGAI